MRSLMFCRDGVLRLRQGVCDRAERRHYPILLPLTEMEERWPGMFLSLLDASLELEEGLDVREALLNLAPWSVQVSAITNCRFDLFLDEVRKPLTKDYFSDLDTLGIVYHQEITAKPDFDGGFDDMLTRIPGSRMYAMRERRPLITDRLELGGAWHCGGYHKGTGDFFDNRDNGFSLHLSPLTKWHHLKLKVIDHTWLHDRTVGSDHLAHGYGLFSRDNPMVEDMASDEGRVYARRVKVQAPEVTLQSVILKGLVWEIGFHGSPEETAGISADIDAQVRECEKDRKLRDSLRGTDGEVDPAALATAEAEIEAELALEEAREEARLRAKPFDDGDLRTLEIARAVMSKAPNLIRAPEGLPDACVIGGKAG